jgi:hypothetical protein
MNTLLKYCLIASFLVGGLVGNVWAQTPAPATTEAKLAAEKAAAIAAAEAPAAKPALDPNADAKAADLTVTQVLNELAIELKADASALDDDDGKIAAMTILGKIIDCPTDDCVAPAAPAAELK